MVGALRSAKVNHEGISAVLMVPLRGLEKTPSSPLKGLLPKIHSAHRKYFLTILEFASLKNGYQNFFNVRSRDMGKRPCLSPGKLSP
jgi:hypothetical protein